MSELESSRKGQVELENEIETLRGTEEKLHALRLKNQDVIEQNKKLRKQKENIQSILTNITKEAKEKSEAERISQVSVTADSAMMNKSKSEPDRESAAEISIGESQIHPPP